MPQSNLPALARAKIRLITALTAGVASIAAYPHIPRLWDDSSNYIRMAAGTGQSVLMPWAGRIFVPALAALLSRTLRISLDSGFELIAGASFLIWISLVASYWRVIENAALLVIPCFLASPLIIATLETVHLPDMAHMAFVAVFLMMFRRRLWPAAALLMTVMVTVRESSLILAIISALVLFRHRYRQEAALILTGLMLGSVVVSYATRGAANMHRMPEWAYLLLKAPANFCRNILGLSIWTDGYAWCDQPAVRLPLPTFLHLGRIGAIGFCAPDAAGPIFTASAYTTIFGILPGVLMAHIAGRKATPAVCKEPWFEVAFLYGAAMAVIGPLSGAPPDRLIGYAWPLLFVALPALVPVWPAGLTARLAALTILTAWMPLVISGFAAPSSAGFSFIGVSMAPAVSVLSLLIGLGANATAYALCRPRARAVK